MNGPNDEPRREDPLAAAIYDWLDPERPGREPADASISRADRRRFDAIVSESSASVRSTVDREIAIAIANYRAEKAERSVRRRRRLVVAAVTLVVLVVGGVVATLALR